MIRKSSLSNGSRRRQPSRVLAGATLFWLAWHTNVSAQLQGYWAFTEDAGTTVSDFSPNFFHGSAMGITPSNFWLPPGQAAEFDGVDDYVSISGGVPLEIADTLSLSVWVMLNGTGMDQAILSKGSLTDQANYYLGVGPDDKVSFRFYSTANTTLNEWKSNSTLTAGTWYHLAVSYDGVNPPSVYINAQPDGGFWQTGSAVPLTGQTGELRLGSTNLAGPGFFDGRMGHARIYRGPLDASQVDSLYQGGYALVTDTFVSAVLGPGHLNDSNAIAGPMFTGQDQHPVLHFHIDIDDTETAYVDSIKIKLIHGDTGLVDGLILIADLNKNAVYDSGVDLTVFSPLYGFDSTAFFGGAFGSLDTIPFSNYHSYLVLVDLTDTLPFLPSDSLRFEVKTAGVGVRGAVTDSAATMADSTITSQYVYGGLGELTLAAGSNNTNLANPVFAGADSVPVMHLELSTDEVEAIILDSLKVKLIQGDTSHVMEMILVEDRDANGTYNSADTVLLSSPLYGFDSTAFFMGVDSLETNITVSYLVLARLNGAIPFTPEDTLIFQTTTEDMGGFGDKSFSPVPIAGSPVTSEPLHGLAGSLALAAGSTNSNLGGEVFSGSDSVPVAQFTLATDAVEPVEVDSIVVKLTQGDTSFVQDVILIRDLNADGVYDGGDILLGISPLFGFDSLAMFAWEPFVDSLVAAETATYLVLVNLVDMPFLDDSLVFEISSTSLHGFGSASFSQISASGGPVTSPLLTGLKGELTLNTGSNNSSLGGSVFTGADSVPVLHLSLDADAVENINLDGLKIKLVSGDTGFVQDVILVKDNNGDGLYDTGDFVIGGSPLFGGDSLAEFFGSPHFDSVPASGSNSYLVLINLDPARIFLPGDNLIFQVDAGGLHVIGSQSNYAMAPLGSSVSSNTLSGSQGSLALAAGSANSNLGGEVFSGSDSVPVAQFTLATDAVEPVEVDSILVKLVQGDTSFIQDIVLVRDLNADGVYDGGDMLLGVSPLFGFDSLAVFAGNPFVDSLVAAETATYLVLVNLVDTLPFLEDSLVFQVASTGLQGFGSASFSQISASGGPVTSPLLTGLKGELTLNTGSNNSSLGGSVFTGADSIPVLHLTLGADAVENIAVDGLQVKLVQGDTGFVQDVILVKDNNGDGLYDTGDVVIGGSPLFGVDSLAVFFGSPHFDSVLASGSNSYLVLINLDPARSFLPGDNLVFQVNAGGLHIIGSQSNYAMAPLGSSVSSNTLSGSQGSLALAAGTNNGNLGGPITSGTDSVAVMHFTLSSDAVESITLDSLAFEIDQGDSSMIQQLMLFKDLNGDGLADAVNDSLLGTAFLNEGGQYQFNLNLSLAAGAGVSLVLTAHVNHLNFSPGDSLQFSLNAGAVAAQGQQSFAGSPVSGITVISPLITGSQATLTLSAGSNLSNLGGGVFTGADSLPALHFILAADATDGVLLDSLQIASVGSHQTVESLSLVKDVNGNGAWDPGTDSLWETLPSNGTGAYTFYLNSLLGAGSTTSFLALAHLSDSVFGDQDTLAFAVSPTRIFARDPTGIYQTPVQGSSAVSPGYWGISGQAFVSSGSHNNTLGGGIFTGADSVALMHFVLNVDSTESVSLDSLQVQAIRGGGFIQNLFWILDDNDDGQWTAGTDSVLGEAAPDSAGNLTPFLRKIHLYFPSRC